MLTPSELKALDKRIAANADRLIATTVKKLAKPRKAKGAGRKPSSFVSVVRPECADVLYAGEDNWPLWVDDVLSGISRLDWRNNKGKDTPLSMHKMLRCLSELDTIDTYSISHLIQVDERSAQRYYNACKLAHDWLVEGYCNEKVQSMKYPEVFVYPKERVPQTDLDY